MKDMPLAAEFARIAAALVDNPPAVVAMDGCSARMLERVEAAVAAGVAGAPTGAPAGTGAPSPV